VRISENWKGVREVTHLVRIRSKGAKMTPAVAAAAIATPKDAHGYGKFAMSADISIPAFNPVSGTFSRADHNPLDHFSKLDNKRL
jgi:hypothetical protein